MRNSIVGTLSPCHLQSAAVGRQVSSAKRLARKLLLVCLTMVSLVSLSWFASGSENSGGGDSGGNSSVVGTWSLTNSGGTWYILFAADGTYKICDAADGSQQRVSGNYTVSGNNVTGSMTNPGVGTGEIKATIDGDAIVLDFIEHWHTPYKVVRYTGNKL